MMKEESYVVFDNSSEEDVNHAKSFWKSLTLHPPLESRLVSANIKQRLPIASPPGKQLRQSVTKFNNEDDLKSKIFLQVAYQQKQKEESERYSSIHGQRESVLNLLHKQRMERLQKEMISNRHKPNKTQKS